MSAESSTPRPSSITTLLFTAVKQNQAEIVRRLIAERANVNFSDKERETPLHYAAVAGNKSIIAMLIKEKANPSSMNGIGDTPLISAVKAQSQDSLITLLRYSAVLDRINHQGHFQESALHVAAKLGDISSVRKLVEAKANIHALDAGGYTPLMSAFERSAEVVTFLLERGSDATTRNDCGVTPLHLAARLGNVRIVQSLLKKKAKVDAMDVGGCTPLQFAKEGGWNEVAALLQQPSPPAAINKPDNKGLTPLHHAAKNGNVALVQTLLGLKAAANIRDQNGYTPLLQAITFGKREVAKLLLQGECGLNQQDNIGNTALSVAAIQGDNPLVQDLIEAKADVKSSNKTGATALSIAAVYGHTEVLRTLLKNNAPINSRDGRQRTPLMTAAALGRREAVALFLTHASQQLPPVDIINEVDDLGLNALHHAAEIGRMPKNDRDSLTKYHQTIESLLEARIRVDLEDHNGRTPLMLAAHFANVQIVSTLLQAKAEVNAARGENKATPLIVAADAGKLDTVRHLLAAKAELDTQDSIGWTALYVAVLKEKSDVVRALLKEGANPDIPNKMGVTPYELAKKKYPALLKLFPLKTDAKAQQASSLAATNSLPAAQPPKSGKQKKTTTKDSHSVAPTMSPPAEPEPVVSPAVNISDENFLKQVKAGDLMKVEALLTEKAHIEARDLEGNTALMVAILNGKDILASSLLEHNASPTAVNKRRQSPLHLAAFRGSCLLETLLAKNDVNAQDGDEQTPLMLAAAKSSAISLDHVKKLMEFKADPQLKNKHGQRAVDLAKASNIGSYLRENTPEVVADQGRDAKKPAPVPKQKTATSPVVVEKPKKAAASSIQSQPSSTAGEKRAQLSHSNITQASSASSRQ